MTNRFYTTKKQAQGSVGNDQKGLSLRFAKGKGYYMGPPLPTAPPSPKQAAANAAANTSSSLQQYLAYLQSNMGREAQTMINDEVQPIIQGYTAQQKAGDAAITADTQTYVNQLNQIGARAEGAYTTAEGQQSALDAAIGSALQTGDVGAAASKLTASLAAAGQSTAPGVAAQAAANSTGASEFASGSAALSQLFASGAAQTAFDAQQPAIAKSAGLQALSTYNTGLTSAEQSAVQDAQSKYPEILSLLNSQANAQVAAAEHDQSNAIAVSKANQPKIYGNSSSGYFALLADGRNVQLTAPGAPKPIVRSDGQGGLVSVNPDGSVTQLTPNKPPKVATPKAPTTKTVNGVLYQYDPSNKKWVKAAGTPKVAKGKTLSPGEIQSFVRSLTTTKQVKQADGSYKQVTSPPRIGYQQAYKYLRGQGVSDQQARGILNTVPGYGPGQNGRAFLNNHQQSLLASAKVQTYPGTDAHGTRFLTLNQYHVLQAAHALPPGHLVAVHDSSTLKDYPPIYILNG